MAVAVLGRIGSEKVERPLCAAVVAAGAQWSGGQRELVRLVTQLDTSGEWIIDGAPTCAHWVADALDIEVCTAREWLRIGRALVKLKVIDAAFAEGRLSYSKLRALTRVATPKNEAELCELAERVPAGRLRHAIAAWLQRHESPEETEARHDAARGLWWRTDVDGMVAGCFRLPPGDFAAALRAAVDAEIMRRQSSGAPVDASACGCVAWPSLPQQRADALSRSWSEVEVPRSRPKSSCTCEATGARSTTAHRSPTVLSSGSRRNPFCGSSSTTPRAGRSTPPVGNGTRRLGSDASCVSETGHASTVVRPNSSTMTTSRRTSRVTGQWSRS